MSQPGFEQDAEIVREVNDIEISGGENVSENSIPEGYLLDIVSGEKQLQETNKELVRQRVARALFYEYGIAYEDMELDYRIRVDGRIKKADIAIFDHGSEHINTNLIRLVICRPEPKVGRSVIRIRDYHQAKKDLEILEDLMLIVPACRYGLWTNGLEFFYLTKDESSHKPAFKQIGDWPLAGELVSTNEVAYNARLRLADPEMLRITFRRCHNFIHGNEGMPKDAAFWQFLYLIFCKIYDESTNKSIADRQFWAGLEEQFDPEGRRRIRERIEPLFVEVKDKYPNIFRGNEEIILSDRALAFMVSELSRYDLIRIEIDVKGMAYQEIVGTNLRGDRGQYFTPRGAIKLIVDIINPKDHEKVLDPACGTGGFLVATLGYMWQQIQKKAGIEIDIASVEDLLISQEQLRDYAQEQLFGADFDPFLIKAAQMNMVMSGDGRGHLYHLNSLDFPNGYLEDISRARDDIELGSMDIVMTNPPFGSSIPITDTHILEQYELANQWESLPEGGFRKTGLLKSSVAPEVLFIERCIQWLKPGGRLGIVLPDGILGNPSDEYIRWWILQHTWVVASVDLPVEVFIVEANVNILTSLLFLQKKSKEEHATDGLDSQQNYPIFMAVAENVGYDRRGKPLYKRTPEGEDIVEIKEKIERVRVGDKVVERVLHRPTKTLEDDLPEIGKAFQSFLEKHGQSFRHLQSFL